MIFPNIDDNKNEFKGVIIKSIIRRTDIPRHIQTFCVAFMN